MCNTGSYGQGQETLQRLRGQLACHIYLKKQDKTRKPASDKWRAKNGKLCMHCGVQTPTFIHVDYLYTHAYTQRERILKIGI